MTRRVLVPWALLVAALAAPARAEDWPQFLGPRRNATSAEPAVKPWGERGPAVVWQRPAGEGYSGPVVAGDTVILFHRVDDREVTEALDAATGKVKWTSATPTKYSDALGKGDGPRATPAVAGGRVYTLGAAGVLTALDLATGKKLWQRALADDYETRDSFFGVAASPLVEGDRVIVNVGARGAGVVAFAADTGKELWKADDHEASYASPVAATVGGSRRVLVFTREGLVGLDPADGRVAFTLRWRSRMHASVNAATPVLAGDLLFLSASYGTGAIVLKVSPERIDEVWKGDGVLSCHYNTPVVHEGHLYGVDGRQESGARLRCVALKTGQVRWTKEGFGCAALVLVGGQALALTEDGDLVLFDAAPGGYRERARAKVLEGTCRAEPALAGGRLYARDGRKLVCLSVR